MDDAWHASPGHRIGVANLDAVEQTRLWLTLGAYEATRTLLGAFRTALLLADTVVIDRNQLFEGIFFVAMSPDRLAWHLGLPPGSQLPLTVTLLNPAEGNLTRDDPPPWRTDRGPIWSLPSDVIEQVERNYLAVPGDRQRVSSPMVAMTGQYGGESDLGRPSVNAPRPTSAWEGGVDSAFLPEFVWQRRDATLAADVIRRGREHWLHAMKGGRVRVEPWRQSPIEIGPALERALPGPGRARDLASELMAVEEVAGITTSCKARHRNLHDIAEGGCGRRHVAKRSLIVRWLDGHCVDDLSAAALSGLWLEATFAEREVAFRWWNVAYYDAICERDDLRILTLHNIAGADQQGSPDTDDIEVAWGLRRPLPSRWARVRTRLSSQRVAPSGDLGIEGEVVRLLISLGPWQFAQLRSMKIVDRDNLWAAPSSRKMFDVALAVRDMAGEHTPRNARVLIAFVRVLALGLLASAFAFRDAGYLPTSGGVLVTCWILLGVVAAFPWDSVASLLRMAPGELESSLRVRK